MAKTKQALLTPEELLQMDLRVATIADAVRKGSEVKLDVTLAVADDGRTFWVEEYFGEREAVTRKQLDQVLRVIIDQLQVLSHEAYSHYAKIAGE